MPACVYMCVCVFLYLPHSKCQTTDSMSKVRTFLGSENILAGPHSSTGLFEGSRHVFKVGVRPGLKMEWGS